jgi:hypothetical protein
LSGDGAAYPTPTVRFFDTRQMEKINLHPRKLHGEWNYTLQTSAA